MLLSGTNYGYISLLIASFFILNSLAAPVTTAIASSFNTSYSSRETQTSGPLPQVSIDAASNQYVPRTLIPRSEHGSDSDSGDDELDPAVIELGKLLNDKCKSKAKVFPKECELEFPKDNKLILRKEAKGPTTHGELDPKQVGKGVYGAVYDVVGHWSIGPKERVVAKWLKFKKEGLEELNNLIAVQEAVDYGIDSQEEYPSLWAIMLWKKGVLLHKLASFIKAVPGDDEKKCKEYMAKVRSAIVEISMHYYKMPGAPAHADLSKFNMLFWQEDNDGDLHANLIDWGVVEFHREDKKTPGEKRVQAYKKELEKNLLSGIDPDDDTVLEIDYNFSDKANCPKPKGT